MLGIEYEKAIVSLVCWKTMKSETYRGMIAMAMMLRNRANAGWFEGSIYNNAIVLGRDMKLDWSDFPDAMEPEYQGVLANMDGIYSGIVPDKTGGALYCSHVSSLDSLVGEITTQIGQFVFYRSAS